MSEAIKLMWWAIGVNFLVAMMNLGFCINNVLDGRVGNAIMSAFITAVNLLVAGFLYRRIQDHKQQEKQRVADILSGKYDNRGSGWQI